MKVIIDIINNIHDVIEKGIKRINPAINDKQLHFLIIGFVGIAIFFIVQAVFKRLSKISITAISFIYTFTVLTVIVFAIEIEQKITKRGNMEFGDITAGLTGFLYLFLIYVAIRLIILLFNKMKLYFHNKKRSRKR